jgi:hypothetical protein
MGVIGYIVKLSTSAPIEAHGRSLPNISVTPGVVSKEAAEHSWRRVLTAVQFTFPSTTFWSAAHKRHISTRGQEAAEERAHGDNGRSVQGAQDVGSGTRGETGRVDVGPYRVRHEHSAALRRKNNDEVEGGPKKVDRTSAAIRPCNIPFLLSSS